MKIPNYFAWLCPIWAVITLMQSVISVVDFVADKLAFGLLHLVLAVAFSFVCGIMFKYAMSIRRFNKDIEKFGKVQMPFQQKVEKPFEEFNNEA